jgi:uncharacterized SAM-binding protein YcdF (DUF218 family)
MKLVRKKEVWVPTWQGFLLFAVFAGSLIYGAIFHLYPFLAQNDPQPSAEIIIIEGWLADDEVKAAALAHQPGQIIVTTGGPLDFGQQLLHYNNYAEVATARLIALGIPAEIIITAPSPETLRDRTYVSAQATRRKLEKLGLFGKSANVYTRGAHARRSYLLFRHVFGEDYPLGVISIEAPCYDLKHWYRHSVGFKHVLMEIISWIYTQFFLITLHD